MRRLTCFCIGKYNDDVAVTIRQPQISKRFLFALFVFFGISPVLSANTTIVVYRNATTIFVAADSKSHPTTMPLCKIRALGNGIFWAYDGPIGQGYAKTISSGRGKSIRSTVEAFGKAFPPQMAAGLERLRSRSPERYRDLMGQDNAAIDFSFFGMEGKIPSVAFITFRAHDRGRKIEVQKVGDAAFFVDRMCPPPTDVCGVPIGYTDAIDAYMAKNPEWMKGDLANTVGKFVQLEIDAEPDWVGPPIRILKIDRKGPHWIQNGEGCNIGNIPKD